MTVSRRERPAWKRLAALVVAVLVAGLVIGVAADLVLGTRPVATLVCAVVASQLSMLVVYRKFVATLGGIRKDPEEEEMEQS